MILKSERFRWIRLKKPEDIPSQPGVYLFYDNNDQPIYIGKAKSLRKRLNSYWTKHNSKEGKILERAVSLDFIITDNEIEALILEGNLIKQYKPDHNVRLKDDKRYPYIKITNERFPRVFLTRKKIDDSSRYYGPYTRVDLIRRSLHILKGIFKIRDCNKKLENNLDDEPCLNYHIERCSGPCRGKIDESDYFYYVNAVIEFINGSDMKQYVKDLKNRLEDCKQKRQFEKASIISKDILSLKTLQNEQKVELDSEDDDIINFSIKGNMAVIVVFSMRDGKIIGKEDYTLESRNEIDEQELIQKILVDRYSSEILNKRRIILPINVEDELVLKWLQNISDGKFSIYTPAKGKMYRLLSLVGKNSEILINEKLWEKYFQDNLTIQDQIGKLFGLEKLENIEAIDISNLGFTDDVGVIVRFENGIPQKQYYRRYKIKNKDAEDDISRMQEVVKRRFSKDYPPPPDILLIDGGKGHLNAIIDTLQDMKISDDIFAVAIAKGDTDKIFVKINNNIDSPSLTKQQLNLLSLMRDEAHRFALAYHKKVRNFGDTILIKIPGIGENRKNSLLKKYKSLNAILDAKTEELQEINGIGKKLAKLIKKEVQLYIKLKK